MAGTRTFHPSPLSSRAPTQTMQRGSAWSSITRLRTCVGERCLRCALAAELQVTSALPGVGPDVRVVGGGAQVRAAAEPRGAGAGEGALGGAEAGGAGRSSEQAGGGAGRSSERAPRGAPPTSAPRTSPLHSPPLPAPPSSRPRFLPRACRSRQCLPQRTRELTGGAAGGQAPPTTASCAGLLPRPPRTSTTPQPLGAARARARRARRPRTGGREGRGASRAV
eukprot:474031-Rhodomonas_salina.1